MMNRGDIVGMLTDVPSEDNGITREDEEYSESDNIVDDIDYCPLGIDENPEKEKEIILTQTYRLR
jgi:hypothetical protein